MTTMINMPKTVPMMNSLPPLILVPPTTAAAMASISIPLSSIGKVHPIVAQEHHHFLTCFMRDTDHLTDKFTYKLGIELNPISKRSIRITERCIMIPLVYQILWTLAIVIFLLELFQC